MDWFQYVGSLGFPIVIAGYLIIVVNKTMGELKDAVTKLTTLIEKLLDNK